jgi:hypothetical protein
MAADDGDRVVTMLQQLQQQMAQLATNQQQQQAAIAQQQDHLRHLEERADRARQRQEHLNERVGRVEPQVLEAMPAGVKFPKPTMIDGKNNKKLRDWFNTMKNYLLMIGLPEDDPRALALTVMYFAAGSPLNQWWSNQLLAAPPEQRRTGGYRSVGDLETAVLAQFTTRKPADEARDKIDRGKQRGTVADWATFLRSQIQYLPDRSDADNLHVFKRGLKPYLAQALAVRDPKTFEEAVTVAVEIEACTPSMPKRATEQLHYLDDDSDDYSDEAENENETDDDEDLNLGYVERTPEETERYRKAGRCLRCGDKGHLARDCPKRDKKKRGGRDNKKPSGDRR